MGRNKVKPDVASENLGINPFIEGLEIIATKRAYKVINSFEQEDVMSYEMEKTPFTRVFEVRGCKEQINMLNIRAKELYLYIMYAVDSGCDHIWINRSDYMKKMGISSRTTFLSAIRSLSDNLYIYPHYRIKDLFWINPHYFFKGSRIHKWQDRVKIK